MGYTPSFTPEYEGGWEDLPLETTPITADALNNYDDAIENIEDYLASDESQANLADAYSAIETYSEGDYRIHNGTLYKCLEDIDEPEEWDSTKWEICLITDEMATSGGTNVIANPSGQATETLTKLQVEETIYGISGGGGSANIWTGTQAEYEAQASQIADGTLVTITDDEQEVVEGGTIYSEEEQIIGLWKDNRPLYQKSYVVTSSVSVTSSWTNTGITLPNEVDRIVNGEVYRNTSAGLFSASFNIDTSNHALRIRFASSETLDANSIITVQYTKSTDAPLDVVVGKSTMYIASSDCYSTEEKEIGVWKDGKPLYQRSYDLGSDLTCASQSWTYTNIDASNIDFIVKQSVQASNGTLWDALEVNADLASGASTKTIGILNTRNNNITVRHITIQYTKTTDTAGSGSYTPASGKAVHYSTDEEVIGTWFGETLYRKVIPITANWDFTANTWVKSNIPKGNIKAMINGRLEIFYQDTYSLHFVQLGFVDNMIAGNSFRQFSAAANGANLILEYTKTS